MYRAVQGIELGTHFVGIRFDHEDIAAIGRQIGPVGIKSPRRPDQFAYRRAA